jgi:uncharacterized membrane protein (UPF0127 family)
VIAGWARPWATRAIQIASALLALTWSGAVPANEALDGAFAGSSIVVQASDSACYRFDVYLALTPDQQRRGLMRVRRLPKFSGMLFVYPADDLHSMWMKNTLIPLDILFIRRDGSVASIARMTEPQSLRSIASDEAVRYVLELNGGVTEELGIDTDSMVYVPES